MSTSSPSLTSPLQERAFYRCVHANLRQYLTSQIDELPPKASSLENHQKIHALAEYMIRVRKENCDLKALDILRDHSRNLLSKCSPEDKITEIATVLSPIFNTCFYDVSEDVIMLMLERFSGKELALLRGVSRSFNRYINTAPLLSRKVALEKAQTFLSSRGLRIEAEAGNDEEKLSIVAYNQYHAILLKEHPTFIRYVRSLALIEVSSDTLSSILKYLDQDSHIKTLLLADTELNESHIALIKNMAWDISHPLIKLHLFHTVQPSSDSITTTRKTISFEDAKSSQDGEAKVIELNVTPGESLGPISLPTLLDMPSRKEAILSFYQLLKNPTTTAEEIIEAFNKLKTKDQQAILKYLNFAISKSTFDETNNNALKFIQLHPKDPAVSAAVLYYEKQLIKEECYTTSAKE